MKLTRIKDYRSTVRLMAMSWKPPAIDFMPIYGIPHIRVGLVAPQSSTHIVATANQTRRLSWLVVVVFVALHGGVKVDGEGSK